MQNMWNTVLALRGPIQRTRNIPGNNHENRLDVAVTQRSGNIQEQRCVFAEDSSQYPLNRL